MDHSQVPPLEDASCDPEELFKMANSFENSPCGNYVIVFNMIINYWKKLPFLYKATGCGLCRYLL